MEKLGELIESFQSEYQAKIIKSMNACNIISLADYPEPEPMNFIVDDFLPSGYITLLYGDGGQGKSYIALAVASCVAAGNRFLNRNTKQGRVLYIDFELDETEQKRRAYKVARGIGLERPPENLFYLSPSCSLEKIISQIGSKIAGWQIDLTIIDSFGAAVSGDSESAKDVCVLFQRLKRFCTVLLLDHQSKMAGSDKYRDKTAFGSVYKSNLSRNVWQLQKLGGTDNELMLALNHKKSNFGPLNNAIGLVAKFGHSFTVNENELSVKHLAEVGSAKDQVFAVFKELNETTAKTIIEKTGLAESTVRNAITTLKKSGELEVSGNEGKAIVYRLSSIPYRESTTDESTIDNEIPFNNETKLPN